MSLYTDSSCSSLPRHFGVVQDASERCYEGWPGCQTSWRRGPRPADSADSADKNYTKNA